MPRRRTRRRPEAVPGQPADPGRPLESSPALHWAHRQPLAAGLLGLSLLLFLTFLMVVGGYSVHLSVATAELANKYSKSTAKYGELDPEGRSIQSRRDDSRRQWYGGQLFRVKHPWRQASSSWRELFEAPGKDRPGRARGFEWNYLERLMHRSVPVGGKGTRPAHGGVAGGGVLVTGSLAGGDALGPPDQPDRGAPRAPRGRVGQLAIAGYAPEGGAEPSRA